MQEELNPYAPPKSDTSAVPIDSSEPLPIASSGTRFLNMLIDTAVRFALAYAIGYGSVIAGVSLASSGGVFSLSLMLIYYIGCEFFFGFTVGKLITGTRVVNRQGKRPSFGQILGRTLSRWVPFAPLSFLGSNPEGGWHDRWSGTRVVRVR